MFHHYSLLLRYSNSPSIISLLCGTLSLTVTVGVMKQKIMRHIDQENGKTLYLFLYIFLLISTKDKFDETNKKSQ